MHISKIKAGALAGSVAALFTAGSVVAASPATGEQVLVVAQAEPAPASSYLSIEEIVSRLEQDGYKVYEIELDDGRYEAEALDASGNRMELKIDPESGEILYQERDD